MADQPTHTQEELRGIVGAFLTSRPKAVFGTLDDKGQPTTSLMLFAADDDFNVYFGTKRSGGAYARVSANPTVALTVVDGTPDPLKVVDIRGTAAEVPADKTAETLAFFKSRNASAYYVEAAEDFVMFKIKPEFVRWLDASSGKIESATIEL